MKERLLEFLRSENKSSAQLADEIGVQPSGISHILSGRNNPSLDFVLKMLDKYPDLSTEWLLFGKGTMYHGNKAPSLFDEIPAAQPVLAGRQPEAERVVRHGDGQEAVIKEIADSLRDKRSSDASLLTKIVMFYSDNTFEEYYPKK
jgi:transcriptional regulator with XRE-family HTH domain